MRKLGAGTCSAIGRAIARLEMPSDGRRIRDHRGQNNDEVVLVNGYCTQCGLGLHARDAFCTSCGTPRPEETHVIDLSDPAGPRPEPPIEKRPVFSIESPPQIALTPQEPAVASLPNEFGLEPAASIKLRAMSWAIDVLVISVAFVVMSSIHELLGAVTLVAGTAAYYIMMIRGPWRGTAGHRIVGLVVLEDESREPIGPRTAGLRLAINAVLVVPFGLGLILNFRILDRSSRRTVHDVGTGTIVVRKR